MDFPFHSSKFYNRVSLFPAERIVCIFWRKSLLGEFLHPLQCGRSVHSMNFKEIWTGGNLKTQDRKTKKIAINLPRQSPVLSTACAKKRAVLHCQESRRCP